MTVSSYSTLRVVVVVGISTTAVEKTVVIKK
jgi:hypothetical protein